MKFLFAVFKLFAKVYYEEKVSRKGAKKEITAKQSLSLKGHATGSFFVFGIVEKSTFR